MALIDLGDDDGPVWVHDGTMLTVMASLVPLNALLALQPGRALRIWRNGIYGEDMSRSQVYYVVAHDDAKGRLLLHNDHVMVDWPSYSETPARLAAPSLHRSRIV